MEILLIGAIWAISSLLIWLILRFDCKEVKIDRRLWLLPLIGAAITVGIMTLQKISSSFAVFYSILAAYLITAAIIDREIQMVHDFLHVLAIVPGIVLLLMKPGSIYALVALILFVILQLVLFRRMYGTADCLVFSACALYLTAQGHGMLTYLLHMAATFGLLGIVQAYRHNINAKGNLKKPVALVPYIAVTIWIFI
jgi:hypothetical protein